MIIRLDTSQRFNISIPSISIIILAFFLIDTKMVPPDYKNLFQIITLQHKNHLHHQAMLSLNFNLNQLNYLNQMSILGNMMYGNPLFSNIRQINLQNTQNFLQHKLKIEETKTPFILEASNQKHLPEKIQSKIEPVIETISENAFKTDNISSSQSLLSVPSKKMYSYFLNLRYLFI